MRALSSLSRKIPPGAAFASVFVALAALVAPAARGHAESAIAVPPPAASETAQGSSGIAVLAGGCFWGVQGVFQHVRGVTAAVSGYSGGSKSTASYETVSTGDTGHAESVRISFDPRRISYGKILQIYFSVATDPTERDRQGPDVGHQYRSEIFAANAEQRKVAAAYIAQLDAAHVFGRPIVTQIASLKGFYPAEAYHQNYAALHPDNPYIAINDLPKIENLRRLFPAYYRAKPQLVREAASR